MITELSARSREIFRFIVDSYLETGEPIGSRTISRFPGFALSPATIRSVMADLEDAGLLFAPHTSAGRLPTQKGMRFYVDGLMQVGSLSAEDRTRIEATCAAAGRSATETLERASALLSGLAECVGLVVAPKSAQPVRLVQFVRMEPAKVLVVLVMQDGLVENRMMDVAPDLSDAALQTASNYLNARLAGRTLKEAGADILVEIRTSRAALDSVTARLVEQGLALMPASGIDDGILVVRGQSRLLDDVRALADLERARDLMALLEEQETVLRLLDAAQDAEGVQIYIGTENRLFSHTGWSMVFSPYRSPENRPESRIVGAIGVIGPTRLNYGRIIPIVDYTAQAMSRVLRG